MKIFPYATQWCVQVTFPDGRRLVYNRPQRPYIKVKDLREAALKMHPEAAIYICRVTRHTAYTRRFGHPTTMRAPLYQVPTLLNND